MEYHKYTDEEKRRFRDEPDVLLTLRKQAEDGMARMFPLFINGSAAQQITANHMREQMAQKIGDAELAEKLIPDFSAGCRRLTVGAQNLETDSARIPSCC